MTDTADLTRRLTLAIRDIDGVSTVFPTSPLLHAAVEGIATTLDLRQPDTLVDLDIDDGTVTITAHIGADVNRPVPDTLREVARVIRAHLIDSQAGPSSIVVTAKLIDDPRSASPVESSGAARR
ncbi:hypothetical protein HQQ80_19775 [Microbacteriaceae bacterium VKM Ac-2855]|nr:hypothetical protein [Microbacteriaceae bacterium VKM Ac-2855]